MQLFQNRRGLIRPTGVSLLEILVALAIAATLAQLAIATYRNYILQIAIQRIMEQGGPAQNLVADLYGHGATLGSITSNASANPNTSALLLPATTVVSHSLVDIITVNQGVVGMATNSSNTGLAINVFLIPSSGSDTSLTWSCYINNARSSFDIANNAPSFCNQACPSPTFPC